MCLSGFNNLNITPLNARPPRPDEGAFITASALPTPESIALFKMRIERISCEELPFRKLEDLRLAGNPIGDMGVMMVLMSGNFRQLKSLFVGETGMSPQGAHAIVKKCEASLHLDQLELGHYYRQYG